MFSSGPTEEEILLQKAEQQDHYLEKCRESPCNRLARIHSSYIPKSSEFLTNWNFPSWIQPIAEKSRIIWISQQ